MEHSIHEEVPKHKITLYSTLKGALGAHMPGLSLKQKLEVREWKLESLRPPIYPTGPWDIRFQRASGKPFAIGECLNGVTDKNMIGANEEVMFTSPNQPIELRLLYPQFPHAELRVSFQAPGHRLQMGTLLWYVATMVKRCHDKIRVLEQDTSVPEARSLNIIMLQPMEEGAWNVVLHC